MQNEEEKELERIETLKNLIKDIEKDSRARSVILGYIEGDYAYYELERDKFVVFPQKTNKEHISKPKGDVDMKNISYRPREKRYIGRKQILNKLITVYGKTQIECLMKLNKKIKEFKSDFQLHSFTSGFTVLQFWEKWYKENKYPFLSDRSREDYEIVKRKIAPLHNLPLSKLTKEVLLQFFEGLEENRTKEKVYTFLKAMLTIAEKEGKIKRNPFNTIVFKFKKRPPKPSFTFEEQEKILNNLKGKELEPIILTYLTTGLRKNELNFQSIEKDIKDNILTTVNLKGRDRVVRYKKIKLSEAMVKIIMDNLEIFHKYTARLARDHFKEFLKKLGISGSLVTCRHTFATNCFYLGKDKLLIAREMGHTTSQITDANYIDIDYNLSKEKVLKLYNNLYCLD